MPPDKKKMTTIWVSKENKALLDKMRRGRPYNDVIGMLLRYEGDVWFDLLSVDGESPVGHTIIFKLGKMTYRCVDGEPYETQIMIVPVEEKKTAKET